MSRNARHHRLEAPTLWRRGRPFVYRQGWGLGCISSFLAKRQACHGNWTAKPLLGKTSKGQTEAFEAIPMGECSMIFSWRDGIPKGVSLQKLLRFFFPINKIYDSQCLELVCEVMSTFTSFDKFCITSIWFKSTHYISLQYIHSCFDLMVLGMILASWVTPISLAFPRLVCRASRNAPWHGDQAVIGSAAMKTSW